MSVREIHLCIVWDRARHIQDAFIEQLRARFKLLAAYELTWSEERFATNLSRFYGKKLTADSDKQRHCGTGSFLVLLFEDESPVYAHRLTLGGRRRVNSAVFDLKDHFRSRAQGSLPIHATNDIDETRHDLFLLLGQRLEDFVASVADSEWQGQIKQLRQELVGDSGWASLPELFTALNETTPYVVLRNFDDLPSVYTSGEHGDIDLLVADENAALIANGHLVYAGEHRVHYAVNIAGEEVRFDFRRVGDSYYCASFAQDILARRMFDGRGFYTPCSNDHYYSLLYHALLHKPALSEEYAAKLSGLGDTIRTRRLLCAMQTLDNFMVANGYRYTRPDDSTVYFNQGLLQSYFSSLSLKCPGDESRILPALRRAPNVAGGQQGSECLSFHLSKERFNLIRPFEHVISGRVLELGAGSGSLTEALSALPGTQIVALEPSQRLGQVLEKRCAGLTNVEAVVGTLECLDKATFDHIILMDQALFADRFLGNEVEHSAALKTLLSRLQEYLAEDGTLLLVCENALSLGMLNGSQISANTAFGGQGCESFGRAALQQVLTDAGFLVNQWLYPFPDHRRPRTIVAQSALDMPLDLLPVLWGALNDASSSLELFPSAQLCRNVLSNGMLPDLANAFLVVANRKSVPAPVKPLLLHYSSGRKDVFAKVVEFEQRGNKVFVKNRRLYPDLAERDWLAVRDYEEPFYQGRHWQFELAEALKRPGWTFAVIQRWAARWFQALIQHAGLASRLDSLTAASLVPGSLFDAIPRNMCVQPNGEAVFFDQEWRVQKDLPLGYILFRGIFISLSSIRNVSEPWVGTPTNILSIYSYFCSAVGLPVERSLIERFVLIEQELQSIVGGWHWAALSTPETFVLNIRPGYVEQSVRNDFMLSAEVEACVDSTAPASINQMPRMIAFHLPQFHQVAENDRWWGEGFTEWTNVRQGTPTFEGHYQPHVPGEMGYYDLSDISVLERQAALAREHGLEGFCFYYYWFDGKRLLEKPVDMLLEHPEIDLPFCLCWANENWTRRWDGGDQEVLIAQTYDPALDERFARDMTPYLSDPRYIRVAGKPVVLVYRGDLIPDLPGTLAAWRQAWRQAGIGEVYLVGVESFRVYDPDVVGFDANCEFLPHQVDRVQVAPDEPLISPQLPLQFLGDYNKLADYWSERSRPPYKRFRTLVPSWDNSARRRKGRAGLFVNATPARYQSWLERTLERTCEEFEGDERLVFINAWNEWGEGCHLEPDERFGRGYLEATRDAQQALQKRLPIQAQPSNAFQQDYQHWCASRVLAPGERARVAERMASWGALPRLLIVIDVSDATAEVLQSTLDSLDRQTYGAEQVWLRSEPLSVQCATTMEWLPETRDWAVLDGHLERAECDWLLLLRAGDVLDEQTLLLLADHSANHAGLACCYFDEDRVLDGEYTEPFFKPDFNLDLLRSYPYCGRVLAFERKALLEVGGFIGNFATLSPVDLLWRLFERKGFGSVGHIAHVLIHSAHGLGRWLAEGAVQEQVALVTSAHLSRLGISHQVSPGSVAPLARVHYGAAAQPRVSIIVHAQDHLPLLQRCVESILEKTSYRHYELILIDNASQQAESLDWFAGMQAMAGSSLQVIRLDQAHSRAALFNLAAARAQGEYLLLLSADTAVIEPGWLEAMLNHAQRPEVGIVGARLIGADQRIRHAGLILGLYGVVGSPFEGADASQPGYMHRALVEQNYSAVSSDCMLVRRDVLLALQGFDESEQAQPFADVDFCLRARGDGYLTVWTPYATLLQGSSGSRAQQAMSEASIDLFYERWLGIAAADPAYSRSLSLQADFRLESVTEQLPWQPFVARAVPSFLCLAADRFGSGQYRVIQPFNALRDYGFAQGAISSYLHTPLHIERMAPDAIILQRLYGAFEPQLRRLKAFSSAFKVFELDDYILELPELSEHRGAFGKHVERELSQAVALCDRLVVSTEELGHALRHLHSDIRVVQNRLEPRLWNVQPVPSPRRRPGRPRVGWAGGAGHTGDLLLLADVIKALASEVDWVFFGMCPAQLMPYVAEYHAGVSFEQYPQRLASLDLDVALAPLERNHFNICKSNLRLLEYGACAYPVICSDIEPYRGVLPVTRVSNQSKAWGEAIRAHLADPQASRRAGLELQAHVLAEWMLTEEAALEWGRAWLPE
nr:glycoside hydrolase family 99-like domain-containing protein [Pseudomonas sp.]